LPALAALAGVALFSVMDALMKRASIEAGVFVALLLRSAAGAMLTAPPWLLLRPQRPRPGAVRLHALRSAAVALMAALFFWGLVRIPMAEGIALSFIAPLIALYLAALILGEAIQKKAIIASVMGFAGVIVIIAARLADHGMESRSLWGAAAILVSAMLYAWNLVLQRQQALVAGPLEVAVFQNLFVFLYLLPLAPLLADWPDRSALADIGLSACLATAALMLLSWAYGRAEAQVLVPLEYTAFGWSALMGWLWFGEPVTATTIAGVVLIVAACLIAARKRTEATAV